MNDWNQRTVCTVHNMMLAYFHIPSLIFITVSSFSFLSFPLTNLPNLGIAMDTAKGLLVPVIKQVQLKVGR